MILSPFLLALSPAFRSPCFNPQPPLSLYTGWNGFIYVLRGTGEFGGGTSWTESGPHHTLVLGPGDHIEARNTVSSIVCEKHCSLNIVRYIDD